MTAFSFFNFIQLLKNAIGLLSGVEYVLMFCSLNVDYFIFFHVNVQKKDLTILQCVNMFTKFCTCGIFRYFKSQILLLIVFSIFSPVPFLPMLPQTDC